MEPVTLAAVGTVALTEGIKFLYAQAGEGLKRWRERRNNIDKRAAQADTTAPIAIELPPDAFEGQLSKPHIHFDALERVENDLREVRKSLADYADGIEE